MKLLKRPLVVFLSILFVLFPVVNTPIIHAANIWTPITDAGFTSNYYYVYNSAKFDGKLYIGASNGSSSDLYAYDGTSTVQVGSDDFGDINNGNIGGIVTIGENLYVSSMYSSTGAKIYSYDGVLIQDITDGVTEDVGDGVGTVVALANYNGNLIAMMNRNSYVQVFEYNILTTTWTQINDNGFSSEVNTNGTTNGLFVFENKLYARAIFYDTDYIMVFDGDTWQVAGSELGQPYYPARFEEYNSHLYITSGQNVYVYQGGSSWSSLDLSSLSEIIGSGYLESIHAFNGFLYVGVSAGSTSTALLKYNGSFWTVVSNSVGDENQFFVMNLDDYNDNLIVATALPGEGPYSATVWKLDESTDYDDDGINNSVEDSAPKSGDANDDGILDSTQTNVTSFVNPVTSNYAVLDTSCTSNDSAEIAQAPVTDSGFNYPAGLMNFTLTCGNVGGTETITMYYFGTYNASLMVARKYNSTTHTYTTIPGAVITNVTIGGQSALKIVYQIKDGGPLDADGVENGVIVDPAGPALNSASVPNTGIGRMYK